MELDNWSPPPADSYQATIGETDVSYSGHSSPPHPLIRVRFDLTGGEWAGFRVWRFYPIVARMPYTWLVFTKLLIDLAGWDAVADVFPTVFPTAAKDNGLHDLDMLANVLIGKPCEIGLGYQTHRSKSDGVQRTNAVVDWVRPVSAETEKSGKEENGNSQ